VFKASRRYAERFAKCWLILSAKYGFIEPDFCIPQNYDVSVGDPDSISADTLREQIREKDLLRFKTVGVLGSARYWRLVKKAFEGDTVFLQHINGNVAFPPAFQRLIGDLIAAGKPFREE
jgi:hypothetical protein